MEVSVKASAKINLLLDIVGKRSDGYHLLQTVMQSVDLHDTVTVALAGGAGEIGLSCSGGENIPLDARNTAHKAASYFFKETGVENPGVSIHIEKRIPSCAGIAGGSAGAAAVLLALNRIFGGAASDAQLLNISAKIGADVPFCLIGGTMLAEGIGTDLSVLPTIPPCFIVLAKPADAVSTLRAYGEFDKLSEVNHPELEAMTDAVRAGDLKAVCSRMGNVFEQSINLPVIAEIKELMLGFGALGACMSGSGSTVFGIFENGEAARQCCEKLCTDVAFAAVCRPCAKGCEIED